MAIMFYDGPTSEATALSNFTTTMTPAISNFETRPSMYNWTLTADPGRLALRGLRSRFNVVTIRADEHAMNSLHEAYFALLKDYVADAANLTASLTFVPVGLGFTKASAQAPGGDPMALDSAEAPYLFVEESLLWADAADDDKITAFLEAFNANATARLNDMPGVRKDFLYLNYADSTQPAFEGYPTKNWDKLKAIREKYDPAGVFTELMSGGWKVAKAHYGLPA